MPFCSFHTQLDKSGCSGFSHTLDSRSAASILSSSQQPAFLSLPYKKMTKKRCNRLAHQRKGWRLELMASSTKLSSAWLISFFSISSFEASHPNCHFTSNSKNWDGSMLLKNTESTIYLVSRLCAKIRAQFETSFSSADGLVYSTCNTHFLR